MASKDSKSQPLAGGTGVSKQVQQTHTATRLRPFHLVAATVLLAILLWTKLGPITAQFPFQPQQPLPAGFSNCNAKHFDSVPDLPGTRRVSIVTEAVVDFNARHPDANWIGTSPPFTPDISNLSFCGVVYSYTHTGYDNEVNVTIYLPEHDAWNGRFQGVGGGGYIAGLGLMALHPAVATGWAAASTDAGLYAPNDPRTGDITAWALTEGGNINWNMMHMFGIRAIEDMTRIGQAVTKQYYSKTSSAHQLRSYWNGCSTGGRQGLMLAQRAPDLYDGILATAPALDYTPLLMGMSHAQQLMASTDTYPQPCEIAQIHAAAIAECDPFDGITDGLISAPELCKFDPLSLIDTEISCPEAPGGTTKISAFAAQLIHEVWRGPRLPTEPDTPIHPGLMHESPLKSLINNECTYTSAATASQRPSCSNAPSFLTTAFINVLLHLDRGPTLPTAPTDAGVFPNMTMQQYFELFHLGRRDISPLISAIDPNLARFATDKKRPKMITWHGLADELIAAGHSLEYYKGVLEYFEGHRAEYAIPSEEAATGKGKEKGIGKVQDFYRYYQVPGVQHCGKGLGPYPGMFLDSRGALDDLVKWVEEGREPEVLEGVSEVRPDLLEGEREKEVGKGKIEEWDGRLRRPLCTWPKRAMWKGEGKEGKEGRWFEREGWVCVDGPV